MRCQTRMYVSLMWILPLIAVIVGCSAGGEEKPRGSTDTSSVLSTGENSKSLDEADPSLPKLPETSPPAGLPIIPWGKRDHFPVIRKPKYWTVKEAEDALAHDEPILGLAIGNETCAYSTNQLNDHEMVIDTISGIPVLVTY